MYLCRYLKKERELRAMMEAFKPSYVGMQISKGNGGRYF